MSVAHSVSKQHKCCSSHALSLIAAADIIEGLETNAKLRRFNHLVIGKCSSLWTCVGRPESSEIIVSILGCHSRTPTVTRWNSLYDALFLMLSKEENLQDLMSALNLPSFTEHEIDFLQEYCDLLKPVAINGSG